jgi:hypothetical protein
MPELIIQGIISAAVVVFIFSMMTVVALAIWGGRKNSTEIHKNVVYPPSILYHGTSLQAAIEIYKSGLWLIGKPRPRGLYLGEQFKTAKKYSGKNGGVVIVYVDPSRELTHFGNGVYIHEIPDAVPYQEYYKIEGLTPIGVLDSKGIQI